MSLNLESKKVFENIYENYGFGSTESRSGPGSTLNETKILREKIVDLVKKYNIKSVTDFPCGDLNWIQHIFDEFDTYVGCDIVEECISENKKRFPQYEFKCLDLGSDNIPDADLLIVRDVIGHQPIKVGIKMVENILNSNCKYLLSTTWAVKKGDGWDKPVKGSIHRENEGVEYGRFYPVNLMSEPFNLPIAEYFMEEDVYVDGFDKGNRKTLALWDLDKVREQIQNNHKTEVRGNLTIVTGLWNIQRVGREFSHYIESFKRFLDIPQNLFIYIPKEYEYLVWEKRKKENTFVKTYELNDIKNMYQPFWDRTQKIRTSEKWLNGAGWLSSSPQASNEWYNPIVQSKMFLLNDVTIWNPFNTDYFFWLDAGITNTVPHGHLAHDNVLEKLIDYGNPFLFLSYPYEANNEIHGFDFEAINRYSGKKVEYVCRGGLFGGHKTQINQANATYYSILDKTLSSGYMGTEESIFSIMANTEPNIYRRFSLDGNGLIVKFTEALKNDNVKLVEIPNETILNTKKYTDKDVSNLKTNLYILTFNFPEQVLHTIESMKKTPEWLEKPNLVLLDNSTDINARHENELIAQKYNFEYIYLGSNTGICGGRQAAAEHFDKSDADYMFFFEDDMTVNPPELKGEVCRNGFRKYIPNLYNTLHKIMLKDKFDFLKLSFTEVYFDNDKQCSWYNVPQHIRTEYWPHYDKLPVSGLDPNVPLTEFKNIRNTDGVTYIDGEIYYANWPMIVSKEGNKKMFIDTKWAHPFEQTWMSHMYQMTKNGELKPALLLASPIWHDRIKHYKPEERREN